MAGSNDNIRFHPMDKLIYEYVAWGNCKVLNPDGTENTSSTFAGNINPIRYRSYYYDTDLGLYYLQTRWYDPEIGRFVNLDQIEYLAPETLNGLNLYAYCLNNPVMGVDPNGTDAILQLVFSVLMYIGFAFGAILDKSKDIMKDMNDIGWNPFNSDESIVLKSRKVSFYKGVPVIKVSGMGGSMSFGAIFYDPATHPGHEIDVLKHERGHNSQLMTMGLIGYLINICIPSPWKNGDTTPWELSADMFSQNYYWKNATQEQRNSAIAYYVLALNPGNFLINLLWYLFY